MMSKPGPYLLIRGDARNLPLASGSVHCCACSPPFYGLRAYGTPPLVWGDGWIGELGQEPTPDSFVAHLVEVCREVKRVLRQDGSLWLNMSDSFARTGGKGGCGPNAQVGNTKKLIQTRMLKPAPGLKPKDLCMVPERLAMALQGDGWFLRAKPPWLKPNSMCESADDRPNVAHESIFLLTKSPNYYFDMYAVRVPSAASSLSRDKYSRISSPGSKGFLGGEHRGPKYAVAHDHETPSDPGGRHLRTNDFFTASLDALIEHHEDYLAHLRSVRDKGGLLLSEGGDPLAFWRATNPFSGAHFATWPMRLVEPMIKASTSEYGVCRDCGTSWVCQIERPQPDRDGDVVPNPRDGGLTADHGLNRTGLSHFKYNKWLEENPARMIGWAPNCSCCDEVVPATVLDPFCGSGTTVLAAATLGRRGVGIDLNADYLAMAKRRIERPHARVARPSRAGAPTPLFAALDDGP